MSTPTSEETPQEKLIVMAATVPQPGHTIKRSISNEEELPRPSETADYIPRSSSLEDTSLSNTRLHSPVLNSSSLENRSRNLYSTGQHSNRFHKSYPSVDSQPRSHVCTDRKSVV